MALSIQTRLMAIMLGISTVAVVLTVLAITGYMIYDFRRMTMEELEINATLTSDRNYAALMFLDNEKAQQNLEVFKVDKSMLAACLYDAQGVLFAGYVNANPSVPVEACPTLAQAQQNGLDDRISTLKEISRGGQRQGYMYLASDTRKIDDFIRKTLLISTTVAALVVMLVLPLAGYFQRAISRPVLDLAGTARHISREKDYTVRADGAYQGEFSLLADAFNDMLAEIHSRDEALQASNETLEQKVTDRTHALEEAKKKAEFASEAKSEFLRNMSHEFRTPLHAMTSFSAYGMREFESAERGTLKEYFSYIQSGAERLTKLVNEVLNISRLESGQQTFQLQRYDMHEVIERCIRHMQPLTKDKGIALDYQPGAGSCMVVMDKDKIVQVLTNILGNAVKFAPEGSAIHVAAQMKVNGARPMLEVQVRDEGPGIPDGELEAIFDSFVQSSRTNTGSGGTGLGLSICRSIIEAHQGSIHAHNNPGRGATFTFILPADLPEGNQVIAIKRKETELSTVAEAV